MKMTRKDELKLLAKVLEMMNEVRQFASFVDLVTR